MKQTQRHRKPSHGYERGTVGKDRIWDECVHDCVIWASQEALVVKNPVANAGR